MDKKLATAEEEENFFHMVRCLSLHILTAPEKEIFDVELLPDFSWQEYNKENEQQGRYSLLGLGRRETIRI